MHLPRRIGTIALALAGLLVGPLAQPAGAAGLTWTSGGAAPSASGWEGLVFDGTAFVSVANSGGADVMLSTDAGTTWRSATTPRAGAWSALAAGSGRIVATSRSGGTSMYSTDHGDTWTYGGAIANERWLGQAFGGGRFVAISNGSDKAIWSTDGTAWTQVSDGTGRSRWNAIAYGSGHFVAIGTRDLLNDTYTKWSTDGTTWNTVKIPFAVGGDWVSMTFGSGRFVAINSDNSSAYSDDGGVSWHVGGSLPAAAWQAVAYSGGRLAAVSNLDDTTAYSDDLGATWVSGGRAPTADAWRNLAAGSGRFVAIAESFTSTMWAVAPVSSTSSSTSAATAGYVPWSQSIGRPESGCPAGTASSWAQWPNGGIGGFTCEWNTHYDPASGTWVSTAGL